MFCYFLNLQYIPNTMCEIYFFLSFTDKDSYERMSQSEIDEILESVTFTHEEFEDLKKKIIGLLCKEK